MKAVRHLLFALALGVVAAVGFAATAALASHQFSDVPNSDQFHDDIVWAKSKGIANGFPDGTFHPSDVVNRGAATAWFHRYSNKFIVRHHAGTMNVDTSHVNSVTCNAGERPIAGGGNTDGFNIFITDINISATSVSVRWETDNNAVQSATTDAWATCMPGK